MSALKALARGFGLERKDSLLSGDWPWSSPPPAEWLLGGFPLSLERAVGLPALLGILLRTGQGVGMMPRKVYERSAEGRAEAPGERVFKLLHDRPSEESTPFAFNADLAGSLAGTGMGFVRKIKSSRGVVVELLVEDATAWKPRRLGGLLVFDHRRDGGQAAPLDQRDLIFVRGMALPGSLEGLSPVGAHRLGISLGLHRQRFELSHYQRGAWPGVILNFPQAMTPEQAERWLDVWDQRHEGAEQAGRTAAIGGGAQATVLPVNLADAQYVEANRMTAEQLGAIYAMPKPFLNIGDSSPVDADWRFWVTFGLGWITTAIDQALNADRDLFPAGSRLYCETVTDALLKPDIRTRYEAYKAARQAGWMTSNEIRKLENLPPHPNGDVLQVIPVGGGEPADKAAALTYLKELLSNADEEKAEILRAVLERANGVGVLA